MDWELSLGVRRFLVFENMEDNFRMMCLQFRFLGFYKL